MAKSADEVTGSVAGALPLQASNNIQGNILAPFNKPYQCFLFISFGNQRRKALDWLKLLVADGVAATNEVVEHGKARNAGWVGVSFTSSGLVTLDPSLAADLIAYDAFWLGALVDREYRGERRTSPAVVGDVDRGDPRKWVVGGPSQYPVDALVTIAADKPDKPLDKPDNEDDEKDLRSLTERERRRAAEAGITVLSWQDCRRLEQDGHGIEPFGFRDGVSQPGIRGFTPPVQRDKRLEAKDQPGTPIIAAGEFVLGYDGESSSYPPLRRTPSPEWMKDGSFQVFLRLRQDVDGWQTQMRELTASSGGTFDAQSAAIGRTPDGEPLALRGPSGGLNDFTFKGDESGERTPRFAHIRKMNPHNGAPDDRVHRLLRRGIPFETPLHVETRLPGADDIVGEKVEHGLVFNAFMASIENQFEFLQRSWASNPESLPPVAADGPDPVVGASDAPCVLQRPGADPVEIHFGRFVWTSGAVYAFAPSLDELRRLAALHPDEVRSA